LSPSNRADAALLRPLLAALLLGVAAPAIPTDPGATAALALLYLALAALLLDLAARFRLHDGFGLLALAGLHALIGAAFTATPLTVIGFIRDVLGIGTLAGWIALAFVFRMRAGIDRRFYAVGVIFGLGWGLWIDEPMVTAALTAALVIAAAGLLIALGPLRRPLDMAALHPARGEAGVYALAAVGGLLLARPAHDPVWLAIIAALAAYLLLILWFERRGKGRTLLDPLTDGDRPRRRPLLVLGTLFVGGSLAGASLPADISAPLIDGIAIAFGLAWLPALSLVLGVRALRRTR
jgi:hypothetical protein